MLDLQWRLQRLDPAASDGLRVIAFFDELSETQMGLDGLLRAAASLLGASVGLRLSGSRRSTVAAADGSTTRGEIDVEPTFPRALWGPTKEHEIFVLRASADTNANDLLVLERLGLALRRADERARTPSDRPPVETLFDAASSAEDRGRAAAALRLPTRGALRVFARPLGQRLPSAAGHHGSIFFSPAGMMWGGIGPGQPDAEAGRRGEATARGIDDLPTAWGEALTALRMTSPRRPVLRAGELGAALALAHSPANSPDLERLRACAEATDWALDTVEVLAQSESVREAARTLNVHHSSVQRRVEELSAHLGFTVSTPQGRFRLQCAHLAFRFHSARF